MRAKSVEERLLRLLPSAYRSSDPHPLNALLAPIAIQLGELEADIERLYANQFIETCEPWAIPYIGDLVEEAPFSAGELRAALARREVANAVAARRRKGTLGVLEQIAWETMEMAAIAVELNSRLGVTQRLGLLRTDRGRTRSLRDRTPAAETSARNVAIGARSVAALRIVAVRLYAGRIRDTRQAVTVVPASPTNQRFAPFDIKLFARPKAGVFPAPMARSANVDEHYGVDGSFFLWRENGPVPRANVRFADLRTWSSPENEDVLVDPELGRIVSNPPVVRSSFHHGLPGWAHAVSTLEAIQERMNGDEVVLQSVTIRPSSGKLKVGSKTQRLTISRCVLGTIHVEGGRRTPLELNIADSIWDGAGDALLVADAGTVHLNVRRSTLLGSLEPNEWNDIADSVDATSDAVMESTTFGTRGYARLERACGPSILEGADDDGELGAFHDELFHERLSRLQARLEDFVPPGWAVQVHLSDIDVVPPEQTR